MHGTLKEYTIGESWESYYERFQQYLIANDIKEPKSKAVFLTSIGNEA